MKAIAAAFNQEKALAGAFSVITNLRMNLLEALADTAQITSSRHNSRYSYIYISTAATGSGSATSCRRDSCQLRHSGRGCGQFTNRYKYFLTWKYFLIIATQIFSERDPRPLPATDTDSVNRRDTIQPNIPNCKQHTVDYLSNSHLNVK